MREKEICLHNLTLVPKDFIRMEVCSGIEPEKNPLLSAAFPVGEYVGL